VSLGRWAKDAADVWGVTEYFDLDKQTIYSLVKVLTSKSRLYNAERRDYTFCGFLKDYKLRAIPADGPNFLPLYDLHW